MTYCNRHTYRFSRPQEAEACQQSSREVLVRHLYVSTYRTHRWVSVMFQSENQGDIMADFTFKVAPDGTVLRWSGMVGTAVLDDEPLQEAYNTFSRLYDYSVVH